MSWLEKVSFDCEKGSSIKIRTFVIISQALVSVISSWSQKQSSGQVRHMFQSPYDYYYRSQLGNLGN